MRAGRARLQNVVSYKAVTVKDAWLIWSAKAKGLDTINYRLDFDNGLSAAGTWLKATDAPSSVPAVLVLNDKGRKEAAEAIAERVNRGEQILALDLLFVGETVSPGRDFADYALLRSTTGERLLGLEAAQVVAAARWLAASSGGPQIRIETRGIRTQVIAMLAAALEPSLFSEVVTRGGMPSLQYILIRRSRSAAPQTWLALTSMSTSM